MTAGFTPAAATSSTTAAAATAPAPCTATAATPIQRQLRHPLVSAVPVHVLAALVVQSSSSA